MVYGVSPDSVERHARFIAKLELPFDLLADPEQVAAEAYGVWQEKKLYGRTFMGIVRSTFLIDAQGKIERAWPKVRVKGHAAAVLAAVRGEEDPAPPAKKKKAAKKKATKKKATKKKAAKKKATKKKAAKKTR